MGFKLSESERISRADLLKLHSLDLNKVPDGVRQQVSSLIPKNNISYVRGDALSHGLFDLLQRSNKETGDFVTLHGKDGTPTNAGRLLNALASARTGRDVFFDGPILKVDINNFDWGKFNSSDRKTLIPDNGRFAVSKGGYKILDQPRVEIEGTGNTSRGDSEAGLSVKLFGKDLADPDGLKDAEVPEKLSLKDVLRNPGLANRALTSSFFSDVLKVPMVSVAAADVTVNGVEMGLRDVVEPLDEVAFHRAMKRVDPKRDVAKGHDLMMFKTSWIAGPGGPGPAKAIGGGDLAKADLAWRGPEGNKYRAGEGAPQTYDLKTDKKHADEAYNEFAGFLKVVNGIGLGAKDANGVAITDTDPKRFNTKEYRQAMEKKGDVYTMLRTYVGLNLAACWDNLVNPSNFVWAGEKRDGNAYWSGMVWDYDSTWGVGWDGQQVDWKNLDVLLRPKPNQPSFDNVPVIWKNLLQNDHFKAYALDYMEHLLSSKDGFNHDAIKARVDQLWPERWNATVKESDTPNGRPRTGRWATNDQIWKLGHPQTMDLQKETLHLPDQGIWVPSIPVWVAAREQEATRQLSEIRQTFQGHAGVDFASGQLTPTGG